MNGIFVIRVRKRTGRKPDFSLCSKIITTIVAIINPSSIREPSLRLPNMTLSCYFMYNCHPPIIANENHHTNHPFAHDPHKIPNAKQNHIQTTMLTRFIRQLYFSATTFGTFYINHHNISFPNLFYLILYYFIILVNIFQYFIL